MLLLLYDDARSGESSCRWTITVHIVLRKSALDVGIKINAGIVEPRNAVMMVLNNQITTAKLHYVLVVMLFLSCVHLFLSGGSEPSWFIAPQS